MAATLQIDILADASKAKKALGETGADVEKLGDSTSGMGKAMAAGAAVGLAGVVALGVGAFNAAEESAKIGRETQRVISTTGASAWTSASQVSELAGAISDKSGADDEAIQSGANLLLTFTNLKNQVGEGNDVFDQATGLALDMSTALGTDMSSASIQLGKALNDPVKGITALSKAGVSFTQEQKDQIKVLQQSGDVLGAQKIVLAELNKEFGGAAEAAGTPLDKLKVKIGNLQEEVGAKLIPAVQSAATFIGDHLGPAFSAATGFVSDHQETVKLLATVGLTGLAAAYVPVVAGQAAMMASGITGFVTSLTGYVVTLGSIFLETAAAEGVLAAATGTLGLTMAPVAAAVAALGAIVYGFATAGQVGAKAADDFTQKMNIQTTSMSDLRRGIAASAERMGELATRGSTAADRLGGIVDVIVPWHDVANSVEDARGEYDKFKEQNTNWQEILDKSNSTLDAATTKLGANAAATGEMTLTGEALRKKLEEIAETRKIDLTKPGAEQELLGLYNATTHVTTSTLGMTEAQEKFNTATATAKDKTDAFKSSLDALIGIHISAAQAETQYSQNSTSLLKTLVTNRTAAAGATEAGTDASLAQVAAVDANNAAIQANAKSALDLANAKYTETGSLEGASASLATNRQRLIDTMVQTGYTEEAARTYIDRLGLTPANIKTQATLDTAPADQALTAYQKRLEDFKRRGGIQGVLGGSIASLEGRAGGGPVLRGGAYLVGERGPELFVPTASGAIIPTGSAGSAGAGATNLNVTVNHTGLGVDSPALQRDLVAALSRWVKRNGPVPGLTRV